MGLTSRSGPARLLGWAAALVLGGAALAVGLLALSGQVRTFFTAGTVGPGDLERLRFGDLATRSVVHARDGSVLQLVHAEENRVPITIDRVPAHVIQAVLAAEDERFYEHGALDFRGMARALVVDVSEGQVLEGGSTITQQLVKTELLTSSQDLARKTREAALAIRLEERMTKSQILERYLNAVYFGNGAYGLQAAAERYFGTDVDKLTQGQGVLLAGLIRNPVGADPFGNPPAARQRRDAIIDRMVRLGQLPADLAGTLKAEDLPSRPAPPPTRGVDYFLDEVVEQLLADPRLGPTEADRYQAVYKGGLTIHTTLDPMQQAAAEKAVADILPDTGGRFNAALASVEPATGAVRALVGGRDFERERFNLATDGAGRQAGSSFKPFALVAALEAGYSPDDLVLGSEPCAIANPGGEPDPWMPGNVEGQSAGILTLADATVQSVNCAYARVVSVVGPDKVADAARRLGITNPLEPHLSITLGSQGVTALQMASAYGTLAADGMRHRPYLVERVVDGSGKVLIEGRQPGERVLSSEHARVVTQVLTEVVKRGTGRAAAVPSWTAAGKTGSTDNNADAWFVGYTPALSTAVWMGSPEGRVPMLNVGGIPRVYGGTYPARIWSAYTAGALRGQAPQRFPSPARDEERRLRFIAPPSGLYYDGGDFEIPEDLLDPSYFDPGGQLVFPGLPDGFRFPPGLPLPGNAGDPGQKDEPKAKKKKSRSTVDPAGAALGNDSG